jgi:CDP-diacylglycerol--serine O-phosphatidyltransferase
MTPVGASPEQLVRASVLVVFGGIFDLLDGRVARLTKRDSEFGVQLDSIADIIGFGITPALIAWSWKLHDLGMFGLGITFWYVLATCFRLARFNVVKAQDSWPLAGHSQGLTSTLAGGSLVTLTWVSNGYLAGKLDPTPQATAIFVAFLGYLMISSIPFRNFRNLRTNRYARTYLAAALACCLSGALMLDMSMWWGIGAALYLALGLVDGVVVALLEGRLLSALLLSEHADDLMTAKD